MGLYRIIPDQFWRSGSRIKNTDQKDSGLAGGNALNCQSRGRSKIHPIWVRVRSARRGSDQSKRPVSFYEQQRSMSNATVNYVSDWRLAYKRFDWRVICPRSVRGWKTTVCEDDLTLGECRLNEGRQP